MRLRSPLLLAASLLTTLLLGSAAAQSGPPLAPPSGPVDPAGPRVFDRRPDHESMGPRRQRGMHGQRMRPALRAALIARFDRDGDGRLTGPEKQRAKRFVRRHQRQLREDVQAGRGDRRETIIERRELRQERRERRGR